VQVERAAPPLGSQEGRELEVQVPVFPLLSPASGFIPTTHHLLQLTQHGLGSSPAAAKESIAGLLSPGEGTMQVEPEVDALTQLDDFVKEPFPPSPEEKIKYHCDY